MHIVEAFHHLPQKHPATFFPDISADLNHVEDQVRDKLHDDVHKVCQPSIGKTVLARINSSHYRVMGKHVYNFHFLLNREAVDALFGQVVVLDDLDRVDLPCFDALDLEDFRCNTIS